MNTDDKVYYLRKSLLSISSFLYLLDLHYSISVQSLDYRTDNQRTREHSLTVLDHLRSLRTLYDDLANSYKTISRRDLDETAWQTFLLECDEPFKLLSGTRAVIKLPFISRTRGLDNPKLAKLTAIVNLTDTDVTLEQVELKEYPAQKETSNGKLTSASTYTFTGNLQLNKESTKRTRKATKRSTKGYQQDEQQSLPDNSNPFFVDGERVHENYKAESDVADKVKTTRKLPKSVRPYIESAENKASLAEPVGTKEVTEEMIEATATIAETESANIDSNSASTEIPAEETKTAKTMTETKSESVEDYEQPRTKRKYHRRTAAEIQQEALKKAAKAQEREQRRLEKEQKKQESLKKKQEAEQKRLEKEQKKQEAEQKRLEKEQKKQEAEKRRSERKAEKERLQQEKEQRRVERAKRQEERKRQQEERKRQQEERKRQQEEKAQQREQQKAERAKRQEERNQKRLEQLKLQHQRAAERERKAKERAEKLQQKIDSLNAQ